MTVILARRYGLPTVARYARPVAWAFAAWVVAVIAVLGGFSNHADWVLRFGLTAIAIGFASVVAIAAAANSRSWWGWMLCRPWLMTCGKYSYAAYVFHRFLIRPAIIAMPPERMLRWFGSPFMAASICLIVLCIATFAIAALSWQFYERPFLAMKKWFAYETPQGLTETAMG